MWTGAPNTSGLVDPPDVVQGGALAPTSRNTGFESLLQLSKNTVPAEIRTAINMALRYVLQNVHMRSSHWCYRLGASRTCSYCYIQSVRLQVHGSRRVDIVHACRVADDPNLKNEVSLDWTRHADMTATSLNGAP